MVIFEKEVLDLMSSPEKDILDVGYGWGITSNYFYNKGVNSLTIIEIREDIYNKALKWSLDKPNVTVIHGDWIDIIPTLDSKFDGIFMDTFCPDDESFELNKSEEEQKKMLDYFFEEPSEKEWNKYVSFEDYCKTIANEGCILSIYEYSKFRKDLNFTIVDTDWGVDGYPTNHKLCWTYFSNGEFNKKERIDATEYIDSSIKSYVRASEVHGVGLFALIDIKKGEQVFPTWKGETGVYKIKASDTKHLPISVVQYILRSFANKIVNDKSEIRFKLTKDCNFLFAEPLCLLNTQYEEGSVDIKTGIAIKDINKDEEIFGNYGNSSQIKLI